MSNKKKFQKDKKYKAVIIGAGKIASQFDDLKSKKILTHAHAYSLNPRVRLVGICDVNFSKASVAAQKWSTTAFQNLEVMFKQTQPDIVSICVPDGQHFLILKKIIKYKPKLVICEKPITTKIVDTEKIIKLYKKNKISVLVNYSRRFDVVIQQLKKDLSENKYGRVVSASGIYSKGILHNGSHLIDLASFLFGKIKKIRPLLFINDYDRQDKTVAGFLQFEKCSQFHLVATDQRYFFTFELDVICEKARLRFINEGFSLAIQLVVPDKVFTGYKILGDSKLRKTKLDLAISEMVKNAVDHLDKQKSLFSTIENAWETQKICNKLLEKYV